MRITIILSLCLSLTARAFADDALAPPAALTEPPPVAPIETPTDTTATSPAITEATTVPEAAPASAALRPWEISLKAGGHFPQIANRLGSTFDVIAKVGYGVALQRRLQLFADFAYSQPSHTSSDTDPRLVGAGGEYSSKLTVRDFTTTFGAGYFFRLPYPRMMSYAGAGLQLHFLWSGVSGSTPCAYFGDQTESSTRIGGVAMVGAGYQLGPGVILGELRFGFTPVSQKVTGSGNIAALSLLVGYGLFL